MQYNIEFQVASLFFVIILNIVYFYKEKIKTKENTIYQSLLLATFVMLILDIVSVFVIAHIDTLPSWIGVIEPKAYLISSVVWMVIWCNYVITLAFSGEDENAVFEKWVRFARDIFVLIGVGIGVAICVLPITFIAEGRAIYSDGLAVVTGFGYAGVMGVLALLYLIVFSKRIPMFKRFPVICFICFQGGAMAIQIFNREILLLSFSCAVTVLLVYFTLENPDIEMIRSLEQEREKAERANHAKDSFLANMSHEIRTPINAILGMNEMIVRESTSAIISEYAEQVQVAGKILVDLVNDVLDFSKIESGKMEILPAKYDLAEVLRGIENLLIVKAEDKGLYFKIEVEKPMPHYLIGDEIRIKQVMVNILNNAFKYTNVGGVILRIGFHMAKEEELHLINKEDFLLPNEEMPEDMKIGMYHIEIEDTGIGIKKEDMDKIFEAFSRLNEQSNRTIEGSGLGLSITSRFLNMMGSRLNVTSEYERGSIFWFDLPQRIYSKEPMKNYKEDRPKPEKVAAKNEASWIAPQANILVVDDVRVNLAVIKGLLKRTKVSVETALSGQVCLDLVKENDYDIILMDHMMPEMDGVETFKNLCEYWKEANKPPVPVIALTANAVAGVKQMFLDLGFTDYISKPIDVELLEKQISEYLPDIKVTRLD